MNFSYSNKFGCKSERNISRMHPPSPPGIICTTYIVSYRFQNISTQISSSLLCTTLQMKEKFLRKDALNFGSYLELFFACRLLFSLLFFSLFQLLLLFFSSGSVACLMCHLDLNDLIC